MMDYMEVYVDNSRGKDTETDSKIIFIKNDVIVECKIQRENKIW